MFNDNNLYLSQLEQILKSAEAQISTILPSDWIEQNVVMGQPHPGPYRYSQTPYCREIVDRLSPTDPARWIAVMKGLQVGLSSGVIIPGMGWIIKESPANTYFTVGAPDLIDKASEKLDLMIERANLSNYIRPAVIKKRNSKTGDTATKKDFGDGFVNITTPNNHKEWRDVSLKYGFIDDFEAAKSASKQSGSSRKLIEGRFAAYKDTHKIFYISTPEIKSTSNIEPAYLLGDQRKYLIPCPCCGEMIELRWNITDGIGTIWDEPMPDGTGIVWKVDGDNKLIPSSIGYVCQMCNGFFKDNDKDKLINLGKWYPTKKPSRPGFFSYHLSCLYAPSFMYDWKHYVANYLEANPTVGVRNESEHMTFVQTCLGLTFEPSAEGPKASMIRENMRPYNIGTVPTKLSQADGNGKIVLLTLGSDCNGIKDDARIDFEIVAHAESGAIYSVLHGSIGTFIPRENTLSDRKDRKRYTYEMGKENSVWTEFDRIARAPYKGDDGLFYQVNTPGIDFGHLPDYVFAFIDWSIGKYPDNPYVGLRGEKEEKYKFQGANISLFSPSKFRPTDAFYLQVGYIKDMVSNYMQLKWEEGKELQPPNYMNYPIPDPENKLYLYEGFFAHYESEHRTQIVDKDGSVLYRWVKKNSAVQNHLWDCHIYAIALREIIISILGKLLTKGQEEKGFTWTDYVNYINS